MWWSHDGSNTPDYSEALKSGVDMEKYGKPLMYIKGDILLKLSNGNESLKFDSMASDSKKFLDHAVDIGLLNSGYMCKIKKSEDGLDTEDRVHKGIGLLQRFNSLRDY